MLPQYKFYIRPQKDDESMDEFVSALRKLSIKCKFGQMADELIRDQLIVHCRSKKAQERLWAAKNPTLKDAISIAKVVEESERCMLAMSKKDGAMDEVATVGKKDFAIKITAEKSNPRLLRGAKSRGCFRCGSSFHAGVSKWCFVSKQDCRKCVRRGHYARTCKASDRSRVAVAEDSSTDWDGEERVLMVLPNSGEEGKRRQPKAFFGILGKPVELMVDCGSLYTIVLKWMWKKEWPEVTLLPRDINPKGYQGESIDVLGFFTTPIIFKSRQVVGKVYVAEDGPPILGWGHQFDLHIFIDPHAEGQVLCLVDASTKEVLREMDDVFERGLGESKGYTHKIILKDGTIHIKHKLRIPVIVRDEVKMLNDMLKDGVIEPVEASEWVSLVIITKKSDGKLRFCVDLHSLNQHVVTDTFPLPNTNELLLSLKSGKYFSELDLKSAYHQIKLHDESKDLTMFITMEGTFRFKRLPFGLSSTASVFQRVMSEVFRGLEHVKYFQDDILVLGESVHNKNLREVLGRLKEAGLTLRKDKCRP